MEFFLFSFRTEPIPFRVSFIWMTMSVMFAFFELCRTLLSYEDIQSRLDKMRSNVPAVVRQDKKRNFN
jgi:hypothetical protein